jgi:hypothetical protein
MLPGAAALQAGLRPAAAPPDLRQPSDMRAFSCPTCRRLVPFEATRCLHCGTELGLDWDRREIVALSGRHRCANRELAACNGLVDDPGALCASCARTRTRPADGDTAGLAGFPVAEAAKRRLLFELGELRLPVTGVGTAVGDLRFDLLSSAGGAGGGVVTGHADGLITLDLAETDPAHRESMRQQLHEPYRTVLGHLRHEVGHYYEAVLVPDGSPEQERTRAVFGDERADYQQAMDRHYAQGAPPDWPERFVSAYATMHPWEDWAETFAHYLHIRDALQTAAAYGVRVDGPAVPTTDSAPLRTGPVSAAPPADVHEMLDAWLPLTYALNALNRSMGAGDLYPFVLAPAVVDKLAHVDELVRAAASERLGTA